MYTHALRLGGGETDAEEVKKHVFFEPLSWKDLYDKKVHEQLTWRNVCHKPMGYVSLCNRFHLLSSLKLRTRQMLGTLILTLLMKSQNWLHLMMV